jgi:hypothetical protein
MNPPICYGGGHAAYPSTVGVATTPNLSSFFIEF